MTDHKHDIEKYLKGELTPAEMHALEKKALADPFLADALEGSESIRDHDLSADLKKIQEAIKERIEKRGIGFSPWGWTLRIAAGLLILAITTYIIISLPGEKEKLSDLALNKKEETPVKDQPLKEKTIVEAEPKIQADKIIENQPKVTEQRQTIIRPGIYSNDDSGKSGDIASVEEKPAETNANKLEDAGRQASGYFSPISADSVNQQVNEEISKALPLSSASAEIAKEKEQSMADAPAKIQTDKSTFANKKVVKGKVTDAEDGGALPGVNVNVKDTNVGTVTDADGNFEIPVSDPESELVFSFVGLQNVEVPVNDQNNIDVKMSTDLSELSEIVVVGYSDIQSEHIKLDDPSVYSYAEPKGGRKAFKNYLVQSMRYPQQALENKIEGKVTIQFVVETTGMPNEFKVLKGIGYGCDEEVIRLVKNGPKWSPSKKDDIPYRGKVKVRLRFTLPN